MDDKDGSGDADQVGVLEVTERLDELTSIRRQEAALAAAAAQASKGLDERSADQRRAAALLDLALGGCTVTTSVQVTVAPAPTPITRWLDLNRTGCGSTFPALVRR